MSDQEYDEDRLNSSERRFRRPRRRIHTEKNASHKKLSRKHRQTMEFAPRGNDGRRSRRQEFPMPNPMMYPPYMYYQMPFPPWNQPMQYEDETSNDESDLSDPNSSVSNLPRSTSREKSTHSPRSPSQRRPGQKQHHPHHLTNRGITEEDEGCEVSVSPKKEKPLKPSSLLEKLNVSETDRALYAVCDSLIDDLVRGEVIPDLLISVITDSSNRFESSDEDLHRAYLIYEDIATPLVKELTRDCVVRVLDAVVNEYLRSRSNNKTEDVLNSLVGDIIGEICREDLPGLVREVASNLVDEYLLYMQLMRRLELVMTPLINEICADIVTDSLQEQSASQIVQSMVNELVVETCDFSILKMTKEMFADRKAQEYLLVTRHSSALLENSMMQLLLLKLVTRNEMATINLHLDRIVRKAMVQRLLTIHLSLDRANQEVQENYPLLKMHEIATSEVCGSVLAAMLEQSLLEEESSYTSATPK